MSLGRLSVPDIRRLFAELAQELKRRGARAELYLVGGTAITLCYDERRATRDLDGVFVPTDEVRRAAAAVARRQGLAGGWLNEAVRDFLPGSDPAGPRYFEAPGLLVDQASPEYLLGMKLFFARAEAGAEDIAVLYRAVGYTTVHEGLSLVERCYPDRPIPARAQFLLEQVVPAFRS